MERFKKNKELVKKYPFLLPRDMISYGWHGSFTLLDDMPVGWRKAFGERMCEEIRAQLVKEGLLDKYEVAQIKEKFGGLRWYDNGISKEVDRIVAKYEKLSERTCIVCGDRATKLRKVWITPMCDICVNRYIDDSEELDDIEGGAYDLS